MKATWQHMKWLEKWTVVLGIIVILSNGIGAFLPPRELWRLLIVMAWGVTVPYIFMAASYRQLVDDALKLNDDMRAINAALLAQIEPWRLS